MNDKSVKRAYVSDLRAEQASVTRRRILVAARAQFLTNGYAASSMASIARAAGVSRETLYKVFGSKPVLVKAVYDVAVAGDDEQVAIADRPEMQRISTDPDARRAIAEFARMSAQLVERLGPLMSMVLAGARSGDPDLRALAETSARERLSGSANFVRGFAAAGGLRVGVTLQQAVDIVWTLVSPEVWQMIVDDRGWTLDDYRDWLARSIADAILPG